MTKAERTRERIFKTSWLPAATGQDASLFQDAHISYLKEVYRSIWLLGPRGLLAEQQVKAMQQHFDVMLAAKHKKQTKMLHSFSRIAHEIDAFEFDHRQELSRTDDRIFNTFMYPSQVTEDLPLISDFFLYVKSGILDAGHLSMVDHALNQAILQVVSMTVNIKRLQRNPDLKPMVDLYFEFCEQWQLPVEREPGSVALPEVGEVTPEESQERPFTVLREQLNAEA